MLKQKHIKSKCTNNYGIKLYHTTTVGTMSSAHAKTKLMPSREVCGCAACMSCLLVYVNADVYSSHLIKIYKYVAFI